MRALAFTPTYGAGPRRETTDSVAAQVCAGQIVTEVSWHNPFPGATMRNVLAQYERGREMALSGGCDALWTVEHDMLVPPGALQMLWDTGAQVAYGVYVLRHGVAVLNTWEFLPGGRNIGESLSLHPDRLAQAVNQGVAQVSGVGFGCTLIRRKTLERIPFRSGGDGSEAPDMPFALDCLRAKVHQVAHFGVLCGHWDGQRWLTPRGSDSGAAVRVRANVAVTVRAGADSLRMAAGQVYELAAGDAAELQRAGYISLVGVRP